MCALFIDAQFRNEHYSCPNCFGLLNYAECDPFTYLSLKMCFTLIILNLIFVLISQNLDENVGIIPVFIDSRSFDVVLH